MPRNLLSADDFRAAAKDGTPPDATVFRFATADPQNVDGTTRTKRFVFSDATVDHSTDSIDAKGWNLSIFKRNPVALFSHMSWEPPIGRASNVAVEKGQLVGDIEFASADVYEFADTIFRLVDGGFLKAVSVGFKPDEWSFSSDKSRPFGIDFKKQTLLEISICPVPCNPNALGEARSLGIDTRSLIEWAEKVLDSGDTVFLPRDELNALRGQAGGVQKRYYLQVDASTTVEAADIARASVKRWMNDPTDVPVLGVGIDLRAIIDAPNVGQKPIDPLEPKALLLTHGALTKDQIKNLEASWKEAKAGRRISAKTKAAMEATIAHHDAATKCLKDAMDADGDTPGDEPDGDGDMLDPQPPGSVVLENLSPEELRMNEVRELRSTIPTND